MKQVDRGQGCCYVECDNCGNSEYIDSIEYREVNEELKEIGWEVVYTAGEWNEFCCKKCLDAQTK